MLMIYRINGNSIIRRQKTLWLSTPTVPLPDTPLPLQKGFGLFIPPSIDALILCEQSTKRRLLLRFLGAEVFGGNLQIAVAKII